MASARYTLNIDPEDLKPQQQRQLTGGEKLANWWHYHWKLVLVIGLLATVVGLAVGEALMQVHPDYSVGLITRDMMPEEAVDQLSQALAAYGEDLNGDGQVVVYVNPYTMDLRPPEQIEAERLANPDDPEAGAQDMMANMETVASETRLFADMETGEYLFYLTDNPAGLQTLTGALGNAQGQPVADPSAMAGVDVYTFSACPVLMGLPLGQYTDIMGNNARPSLDVFKNLQLVRRTFPDGGEMPVYHRETEDFFFALLDGAVKN